MTSLRTWVLSVVALVGVCTSAHAADPFVFQNGDRVVLLGSTLIEREQKYGFWELALTLKNRDQAVTFRNLGWSGDTVFGEARNGFDQSPKGFTRLVSQTKELKPTVIIVCYGHNESFEGPAGVAKFTAGLEKLLDALAVTKARIVLLSPTPFEKAAQLPNPEPNNRNLALYRDALQATAQQRALGFVDLYQTWTMRNKLSDPSGYIAITDNGLHLTPEGYRFTADILGGTTTPTPARDALRAKIIEKNQLFFHRWRPQNETYLFGFRKHEQGKNAKDIPAFDPLVAVAEKEIQDLKSVVK